MTAHRPLDLIDHLSHALMALALMWLAYRGGGSNPPAAPSAQLAFPFMMEAPRHGS